MGLNNLGLGFVFTAKDLAGRTVTGLERKFDKLEGTTEEASLRAKQGFQQIGIGLAAVAVGTKALDALFGTVQDAREYGKAIGEVSTLTDEATFPTAKMKELTQDLAEQFGLDAMQQAPALYQAISAGATDVSSATELMEASNRLAVGGVTDLTTSVDVLSSAVNVFGAQGLDAADASDTLFVAIKAGKTTAGELGSALGRVLPIAKSLGVNFQEVNAAIAATTANGLQTRRAVTGMNAALANVIKPSKDARKEAKRLGIEFDQSSLRAKGMKKFLDEVTSSSKFNANSLSKLFGSVEGLNFIQSLTSEGGEKFASVLQEMEGRQGAADRAFQKMNGTLDQQIKQYEALKKNVRITIGEALAPVLIVINKIIGGMLRGFRALPKPIQKTMVVIAALTAALTVFIGIAVAVRGAVLLLGGAFRQMLIQMLPMLLPFAKFILIAAAVIAVALLLKKAFDENIGGIGDAVREAWADIKPALIAIKDAFFEVGRALFDALEPLFPVFKFLFQVILKQIVIHFKIVAFIIRVVAKVIAFLINVVAVIIKGLVLLGRALIDLVVFAFELLVDGVKAAWKWLREILEPAIDAVSDVLVDLADAVGAAWSAIMSVIQPVVDAIGSAIQFVIDRIDDVLRVVREAKEFADFLEGEDEKGDLIITDAQGREVKISNPELLSPQEAARLGISPSQIPGGGRGPTNFPAAQAAGAPAAAGPTQVQSTIQADIKLEVDGEEIARVTRKIEAENQTRRSQ